MKKQSIFILLSLILSACASSQHTAPIEYNNSRSNKTFSTKTNPTISDDGEIISTGTLEVKENEIISPNDNINDGQYISPAHGGMVSKTKIIYHEVEVGETIEEISAKYGVKVTEIAALNDLESPYNLEEFQVLKIKQIGEKNIHPDSSAVSDPSEFEKPIDQFKEVKIEKPTQKPNDKPIDKPIDKQSGKPHDKPHYKQVAILQDKKGAHEFIMPLKGKIIAKFGDKTDLGVSKGISISAKAGEDVLAAASGKVIYADYDATFGNLIIIKLDGKNIVTSYAHLDDITMHKGADVKQGDLLGHVGSSGKVKQPQLNFGIREGKVAKDPAKFLKY